MRDALRAALLVLLPALLMSFVRGTRRREDHCRKAPGLP
jgi:hypothetical protein